MIRFILFLIKLVGVSIILLIPVLMIYKVNLENSILNKRRKNYSGEKIIFLGSSHGRDAFMNGIIENSYNFSSSGFTFEESYKELLRLENENYVPKTVVLAISIFSIYRTNRIPKNTNIVFDYNKKYGHNLILNFFNNDGRKEFIKVPKLNFPLQHFTKQKSEKTISLSSNIEYKYHTTNRERHGMFYLQKIGDFCKKHKIRLILLIPPFSKVYNSNIKNDTIVSKDLKQLKDTTSFEFYDYSKMFENERFDSIHFIDGGHLNKFGSNLFTCKIKQELNLNSFGKEKIK